MKKLRAQIIDAIYLSENLPENEGERNYEDN
jgi:hypothetical protein